MDAPELCEVCGQPVAPEDAYRAEMAVGDLMCPTPMTFHQGCYDTAARIWEAGDPAGCGYDPEHPETGQWPSPTAFE